MNNEINVKVNGGGLEGLYNFKAINAITGKERYLGDVIATDHPNMILNSGLESIATNSDTAVGCRVGTSSIAVVETQTALGNTIGSTTTVQANTYGAQASAPYFSWIRRTFRFGQGVAAGNLTEVGVYTSASGNPLFSRALIVDSQGNPTTLTILSDEYLDVTYELRVYPNLNDQTFIATLLGVDYTFTARAARVTTYPTSTTQFWGPAIGYYTTQYDVSNGALGAITGTPTGSSFSFSTGYANYNAGSYQRTAILSLGLNDGNLAGGISAALIRMDKAWLQFGISPAIPKDNFKTLVLNITISWARYTP